MTKFYRPFENFPKKILSFQDFYSRLKSKSCYLLYNDGKIEYFQWKIDNSEIKRISLLMLLCFANYVAVYAMLLYREFERNNVEVRMISFQAF